MKTNEIRQKYLDYFQSKDHTVVPSDVLVPKWDPTVLFTPAGMNQFKDHFLGKVELEFTRATSSQKCLRTGDIENVGRTAYHHTFFEMLGNFSFGDYFKREAILWAWEFLTDKQWLAIDPDRLTVSVYLDDDEAAEIWHKEVGLPLDRIARLGEHDNFWPAGAPTDGPDGVCGPCSEIFFHPENGPECEIWNLVFTQFNRTGDPPDNLFPLPSKNIDTGMGLERIAATLQGVTTNFHIDSLLPIVEAAGEVVGLKYDPDSENGRRLRRIADHVRACTMAIHENVYPGSQKEHYVIRRLLRRAVLQGHEMGIRDPFLYQLVPVVVEQMKEPYPDLVGTAERVAEGIKSEERSFLERLDDGLQKVETIFEQMKTSNQTLVDGREAAELYTTFGIPAELFASMAGTRQLDFDWDGYRQAMEQHAVDSGAGSKGVMGDFGPIDDIKREVKSTEFLGYDSIESTAVVQGLLSQSEENAVEVDDDGNQSESVTLVQHREKSLTEDSKDQVVVIDQTPFYAESGGQVGDTGWLIGPRGKFHVTDTQKNGDVIIHLGHVTEGEISEGDTVTAVVDQGRRDAIRRAHSATHVLHYALQQTLGEHAQQRGSKVTDDLLRFDFSNSTAVDSKQLAEIERQAIEKIESGVPVRADILPLEEARSQGAMMLFGEKYPDPVRMISIGQFSKELCGGTHVENIGDVEAFEIVAEENISAGTRRIQALTGQRAKQNQTQVTKAVRAIAKQLNVPLAQIPAAAEALSDQLKDLKKQLASGKKPATPSPQPATNPTAVSAEPTGVEPGYLEVREILRKAAQLLKISVLDVENRLASMQEELKTVTEQLEKQGQATEVDVDSLIEDAVTTGDIKLVIQELPGSNRAVMRQLIDKIRKKTNPVAVFFATSDGDGKVLLTAGLSRDLTERGLSAGDWIKQIAPVVDGSGGGKPDLAQAGGKSPEKIGLAMEKAKDYMVAASVKSAT